NSRMAFGIYAQTIGFIAAATGCVGLILAGLSCLGVAVRHLRRQRQHNSLFSSKYRNCSAGAFVLALVVGAAVSRSVRASTVYSNDFESGTTGFTNAGVLSALTR